MTNIYENVIEEFNKRGCKLLTTKEEHNELTKEKHYRLNYIASCGHNHIVFFNVFKSRNTGVICPACKNKKNGDDKKEQINTGALSKIHTLEQEFNCISKIQELVQHEFEIIKAFDGCMVDIIFRPKSVTLNNWVGIQVKTTKVRHLTYSFHINNTYKDCLILLYCCEDENMWLIPENVIQNQCKISIGFNKSKYNIYKVNYDNLVNKLNELYYTTTQFPFDIINTPINIYQQREQLFRKMREEKIDFIDFHYDNMEGTVYDFKINNLKIQEKVTKRNKENRYIFCMSKNNGTRNKNSTIIQYDVGDNDFYWLNCEDCSYFFVIPEKILMDKRLIGNNGINKTTLFKITVKEKLHKNSNTLQPYLFDYENIDKERLLEVLNLNC